jgi:hypothetical protein
MRLEMSSDADWPWPAPDFSMSEPSEEKRRPKALVHNFAPLNGAARAMMEAIS